MESTEFREVGYPLPKTEESDRKMLGVIGLVALGVLVGAGGAAVFGTGLSNIGGYVLMGSAPLAWIGAAVLARSGKPPVSPLGAGEFGRVYPVQYGEKSYALKVWHGRGDQATVLAQYKRAMIIGNLGPDCLVRHHDFVKTDEGGYQGLMELIDGVTLDRYLVGKPDEQRQKELVARLLDAYDSVLAKSVVPGDLHDENIMITPDGQVRLIDLDSYLFLGEQSQHLAFRTRYLGKVCEKIYKKFDRTSLNALANERGAGEREVNESFIKELRLAIEQARDLL